MTTIGDSLSQRECDSILEQVIDKYQEVNIEELVRLVMGGDNDGDNFGSTHCVNVAQVQEQQQQQGSKAVRQILH